MDFLDPKKKRAHRTRLFIGYFLVAVAVSIGTLILLLETLGYDPYHRSREVVQNGLVFVENKPQSASITVNRRDEGRTGKRLVLPEGSYDLVLKREGYRTWQRHFRLEGGGVEQLTYPLLVPLEPNPQDVKNYGGVPRLVTQSPDRRWALTLHPNSLTAFDLIDLNDKEHATTSLTLPQALVNANGETHSFEAIDWASNNRHVLIKHTFATGAEFLMIDREEPERSFNVNQVFPVSITQVFLRDRKFDRLHILDTEGTLWLGQTGSGQLTPLVSRVTDFTSYGEDVILYATKEAAPEGRMLIKVKDGDETYTLRELPVSQHYALDVGRYDGRWYMTIGTTEEQRAYVYRNPRDQLNDNRSRVPAPIVVLKLNHNLVSVSTSTNSRFIGAQGGGEFSVYDAEHDRQHRFDTEIALAPDQKAVWVDGFRYMLVGDNKAVLVDFDGSNQEALTTASPNFLPMLGRDNQSLYTLTESIKTPGATTLTRASLLASQDQ